MSNSIIKQHVAAFHALIEAMRAEKFAFKGKELKKPTPNAGEEPEAFARRMEGYQRRRETQDRSHAAFPAMSCGVKALKRAMKAAGWRMVSLDKFPKHEVHIVKQQSGSTKRVHKLAYHIEYATRADDKSRPMAVLCPQDGTLDLMTIPAKPTKEEREESEKVAAAASSKPAAPPLVPFPVNAKGKPMTKLSPLQWDLERFKPFAQTIWVKPGMNEVEAKEAAIDGLCTYLSNMPEHLQLEAAKKAVKRWAPLSRELEGMDKYKAQVESWVPAGTKQEQAVELVVNALVPMLTHLPSDWRERVARNAVATWGHIGREDDPTISSQEQMDRLARKARRKAKRLKREQVEAEKPKLAALVEQHNRRASDMGHAVPNGKVHVGLVEVVASSPAPTPAPKPIELQVVAATNGRSAMALAFANALRK